MANYVSQVTLPDGTSYDVRELFPHVGNCTDAAATAAKTVTIGNFKLYTGAWVVVKFSNTNSADVATLTLNVDGTGAKPIKYKNANLGWASQLTANRYTHFIYDGTNYQIIGDFNTDTYDRTSQQTMIYAGTVGVFNYSLCALDNNQRMQSFTTTAGTGTSKAFNTSAKFMYPAVIMYNAANSTYANGTAIANNVLYEQYPSVDLRYSCNKTTSAGFTQYKPVYLECTLNSNGTLSITTNGLTQTFVTGKYYLLLGCMYNTSVYQLALFAQHPLFYYDGTNLCGVRGPKGDKGDQGDPGLLDHKTVTASTLDSTAGDFAFSGDGDPFGGSDWVGLQIGDSKDKFQLVANSGNLLVRQNDSGGTASTGWTDWKTLVPVEASSANGKIKINGTDTTVYTHPSYASAPSGLYKITVDEAGHVSGTVTVASGDIPPLNYVPNTQAGVNAAINLLGTGSSTPTDEDYYISQYVGGGTTTTTYHRRPMSALWSYVKGKADSVYLPIGHTYPLSIAADAGTNQLTLSANTKYKLTAGGSTFIFTTPTDNDTKVNVTLATTTKAYLLGTSTTPTTTAQPVTALADTGVYLDTTAGGLCATNVKASSTLCANTANSNNAGGISLYGTDPETYGVMFRGTSNSGKHGYVQSDWATYFTMDSNATRGWIFRRKNDGTFASISAAGHAVFNGSVTVGGNSTNTSGCRMQYNSTTQSLDFVFV